MYFPKKKTKIVCTIGPASEKISTLEKMIKGGMNIARLNFAHGDFAYHKKIINNIRKASNNLNIPITIMADLAGPKIRIGKIKNEPIILKQKKQFILTTEEIDGNENMVSVSLKNLHNLVKPNNKIFLNDGFIQLKVKKIENSKIYTTIIIGGDLRSNKGLNVPGINLGISALTDYDRQCVKFAFGVGIDALSMSFVETKEDILTLRKITNELNYYPFIIAKIERMQAVENAKSILNSADGIMVARGDLGVEMPIEQIPSVQKKLIKLANELGKPVITATQMLESMVRNTRPTRAEVTDVANAMLDGTDCVMLSEESAMGKYPVESVKMLNRIAITIERTNKVYSKRPFDSYPKKNSIDEVIALDVAEATERLLPDFILAQTNTGTTARLISRFKLPIWIVAITNSKKTFYDANFSYGVKAIYEKEYPKGWESYLKNIVQPNGRVILAQVSSARHTTCISRMDIIDFS